MDVVPLVVESKLVFAMEEVPILVVVLRARVVVRARKGKGKGVQVCAWSSRIDAVDSGSSS